MAKTDAKNLFFSPGEEIDLSQAIQRRLIYHKKIKNRQRRPKMRFSKKSKQKIIKDVPPGPDFHPQALAPAPRPWLQPPSPGSSPWALATAPGSSLQTLATAARPWLQSPTPGPWLYPLSPASDLQALAPAAGTWLQTPLCGIMGQMKKQNYSLFFLHVQKKKGGGRTN